MKLDWWGRTVRGGSPYPRLRDADRRRALEWGGAVGGRRRCDCETAPRRAGRQGVPRRADVRQRRSRPARAGHHPGRVAEHRRHEARAPTRAPGRDLDRSADRHAADGRAARRLPDGPECGSRVRRGPRLCQRPREGLQALTPVDGGAAPGAQLRRRRRDAPPRMGADAPRHPALRERPPGERRPRRPAHQRHRLARERPRRRLELAVPVRLRGAGGGAGRRRRGARAAARERRSSCCSRRSRGTRLAWQTVVDVVADGLPARDRRPDGPGALPQEPDRRCQRVGLRLLAGRAARRHAARRRLHRARLAAGVPRAPAPGQQHPRLHRRQRRQHRRSRAKK